MHTDAETHLLFIGERILNRDRALHRIDGTREIGDDAVAGATEDPPAVGSDALIENGPAGGQPAQGAELVLTHKPAVAGNIGGEDRHELADRFPLLAHGAHEANPLTMRGANEALLLAAVADRAARGIDPRAQRRFRDDPRVPHRTQQIVLADDAFAVADRVFEGVENLRLKRDQRPAAPQLAPGRI